MKRLLILLLLCLPLATVVALRMRGHDDRVYSVQQLQDALRHDRSAWGGRTVLLRGVAYSLPGTACAAQSGWCATALSDPDRATLPVLRLGPGPTDPLTSIERRLPWLKGVAPSPQVLRWSIPAVYRVRLLTHTACAAGLCYDALLLDPGVQPFSTDSEQPGLISGRPIPTTTLAALAFTTGPRRQSWCWARRHTHQSQC